jgi:alpha 1,3-glucosidase
MFPNDKAGFGIDDQFYLGDSGLLSKPISVQGATETEIYLSDDQVSFHEFFSPSICFLLLPD